MAARGLGGSDVPGLLKLSLPEFELAECDEGPSLAGDYYMRLHLAKDERYAAGCNESWRKVV